MGHSFDTTNKAAANARVHIGRFLFTYRNWIFPVVAFVMLVFMRPMLAFGSADADLVLDLVGLCIALVGQLLRAIVIGLAYIKRGGTDRKIDAPVLVREGVFSVSRNPLYVGNMLIVLGLVVIHNSPWAYALVLPAYLFSYLCIVEAEEEFLRGKFSVDYESYCAEVNRFIPAPGRTRWVFDGGSFDLKKIIRKDYNTAFFWISMALGLMAWERIWVFGADATHQELILLLMLWAITAVVWAVIRFLKKKKYLTSPR